MADLRAFREAVGGHRRTVGRTQQQLASAIGLSPYVLSRKLNGKDALLTARDAVAIVTVLADWGALSRLADVQRLLALLDIPLQAVPRRAWDDGPLARLRPGSAAASEPAAASTTRRAPVPLDSLIGRADSLQAVRAALDMSRLVTLTGVGGTGKTRLALESADRLAGEFRDGTVFADLSSLHDTALAAIVVARAVGLSPSSVGTAESELVGAVRELEMLVVVDNVEQLAGVGKVLVRLVRAAPRLRLLVTSRVPLRVRDEHVLPVPPLPPDDATQLFLRRAWAAGTALDSDDDRSAVARICVALDGLPLAIELAAARAAGVSPQQLEAALQRRLELLSGGAHDRPYRQQSLRATLDWSYALLTPDTARFFDRLGVLAGRFDARAAAALAELAIDEAEALRLLYELAEQSLITSRLEPTPTFRMLQTVREYALQHLTEQGGLVAARFRHLEVWTARTRQLRDELRDPENVERYRASPEILLQSYEDILAALDFAGEHGARDPAVLETAFGLVPATVSCLRRGPARLAEAAMPIERILRLGDEQLSAATRAQALVAAAALCDYMGDYRRASAHARSALRLARGLADDLTTSAALRYLGEAQEGLGDLASAEASYRGALAAAERSGDFRELSNVHNMIAEVTRYRGDYRQASAAALQAVRHLHEAQADDNLGPPLGTLVEILRDAGAHVRALRLLRRLLRMHAKQLVLYDLSYHLEALAATLSLMDSPVVGGEELFILVSVARRLRSEMAMPLPPIAADSLEDALRPARERTSQTEHARAQAQGAAMSVADALSLALGLSAAASAEWAENGRRGGYGGRPHTTRRQDRPSPL
jgi:non-specific serine/threonine protein kinase